MLAALGTRSCDELLAGVPPELQTADAAKPDVKPVLRRFAVAGANKQWCWADAVIDYFNGRGCQQQRSESGGRALRLFHESGRRQPVQHGGVAGFALPHRRLVASGFRIAVKEKKAGEMLP